MYERILSKFEHCVKNLVTLNPCPFTAVTFLDCMAELVKILIQSRSK